ncbi:hypothetical protein DXO170_17525 [Xanthomonas oryzae pv. oryzae]|uniref:Uncharacterized protein n=1 Tax=Xanthomonas oryzae pv. oryzae TaxID=64187 RepID=A0A854CPF4_XANOO|nr:hypothetical protein BO993_10490 [Xanthomonas oryzae pv. oryzae]OLG34148.1 hypothetical protein BXO6_09230 [Xanthomonas oryzae pv. oryzae]OLG34262.1 hypothetical protein BXO2_12670 [Xanthomonas oryzae pv. oryzae]OLG49063.1 hypothetical protein BXO33_01650 [Xanthomonas oryzae pv. oryzae]OLG50527.1 hypothetical protein BXO25_01200 [Xanthomonas oryzae pv. oryzae]
MVLQVVLIITQSGDFQVGDKGRADARFGALAVELDERRRRSGTVVGRTGNWNGVMRAVPARMPALPPTALSGMRGMKIPNYLD